jgi:hypothetical protein
MIDLGSIYRNLFKLSFLEEFVSFQDRQRTLPSALSYSDGGVAGSDASLVAFAGVAAGVPLDLPLPLPLASASSAGVPACGSPSEVLCDAVMNSTRPLPLANIRSAVRRPVSCKHIDDDDDDADGKHRRSKHKCKHNCQERLLRGFTLL